MAEEDCRRFALGDSRNMSPHHNSKNERSPLIAEHLKHLLILRLSVGWDWELEIHKRDPHCAKEGCWRLALGDPGDPQHNSKSEGSPLIDEYLKYLLILHLTVGWNCELEIHKRDPQCAQLYSHTIWFVGI